MWTLLDEISITCNVEYKSTNQSDEVFNELISIPEWMFEEPIENDNIEEYETEDNGSTTLLPILRFVLDEKFHWNASKGEQNFCFLTFLKVTDLSSWNR